VRFDHVVGNGPCAAVDQQNRIAQDFLRGNWSV
jgi:hypothetical protein